MLSCKEIKGTVTEPNIDDKINEFFDACDEHISIINLMYSTTAIPYKNKDGAIVYQPVSSCLIMYNSYSDEELAEMGGQ